MRHHKVGCFLHILKKLNIRYFLEIHCLASIKLVIISIPTATATASTMNTFRYLVLGLLVLFATGSYAQQFRGFLDTATGTQATGWACIANQPFRPLTVQIWVDGRFVDSVVASQRREAAVGQQCGGNPFHGFVYNFNENTRRLLADGRLHNVRAIVVTVLPVGRFELNNSPRSVQIQNFQPKGFLDRADFQGAAGWTCDQSNFNQPLRVNIFIDNIFITSVTANQQREQSVGNECGGNVFHGFLVNWNQFARNILNNGRNHQVTALAVDIPTGAQRQLTGSPKLVSF